MFHNSPLFSDAGVEEWLLYFKASILKKTFVLNIVGGTTSYEMRGRHHVWSGQIEISLDDGENRKSISLLLKKPDKNSPRHWPSWGMAPLMGPLKIGQEEAGKGYVYNSHEREKPVISLEHVVQEWKVEAYRAVHSVTASPMLVFGLENCEMLLESYGWLDRACKKKLPDSPERRNFVGSIRSPNHCSSEKIERLLEPITLIVAITELFVVPDYMTP